MKRKLALGNGQSKRKCELSIVSGSTGTKFQTSDWTQQII